MNFFIEEKINSNVCFEILDFFHNNPKAMLNRKPGNTLNGVDLNVKKSTDLTIYPEEINSIPCIVNYIQELKIVMKKYVNKFKYSNYYGPFSIVEGINIQWYKPNEGYYEWHTEKTSVQSASRHLAFMTYLNTVKRKGETQFYYQNKKIKPIVGKTLIWPTDWTYTHRGIPSPTEDKYIITGWYNFV